MTTRAAGRLFLMRHAHSSWALPGQRDHQRPLDDRGRTDAPRVGAAMEALARDLDLVICSTATRARETLEGIRPFLPPGREERFSDDLYALGTEAYLDAVKRSGVTSVLILGHNPTIEDFAAGLAKDGVENALAAMKGGFPTGALAVFEFPGPLADVEPGTGLLRHFIEPRDL